MVHLTFSTDVKNYKLVFRPSKKLFNELYKLTETEDFVLDGISIHRVRNNFIIDIDKDDSISSLSIFDLYVNTDPLKWTSIINHIKLPS